MVKTQYTRRHMFAILIGLLIILVFGAVTSIVAPYFITQHIFATVLPLEVRNALSQHPIVTINLIIRGIAFLSPVFGGLAVGLIVRKKGWLYGLLLGIVLIILGICLTSLTFLLPTHYSDIPNFPTGYGHTVALHNILNQILAAPKKILLTTIGGMLSEVFTSKKSKIKN